MIETNGIDLPDNFCRSGIFDCIYNFTHNSTLLSASISFTASLLAIITSCVAAYLLWKQIKQTEQKHQELISRRHEASKLKLNISLVVISEFLKETIIQLAAILIDDQQSESINDRVKKRYPLPSFPEYSLETIVSLVETSPSNQISSAFSNLSHNLQLTISRTNSIIPYDIGRETILTEHNIISPLAHCIFTYGLLEKFFAYGRGGKNIETIRPNEADELLLRLSLFDHNIPMLRVELDAYIIANLKNSTLPLV